MANLNKPFGLAPHRNLAGGKWNQESTKYYIPSTDTLAYYVGDTVLSAAAGDTAGVTGVIKASLGTETLRGVIIGVEPSSQGVSLAGTALSLDVLNIPATKAKAYYVYVPQWPQYVTHPPYVKGFKHHDGYGLGMRLLFTWLDK